MKRLPILTVLLTALSGCDASSSPGKSSVTGSGNSIFIIVPYKFGGTWVFDDANRSLEKEPFVGGIPQMLDVLTSKIPNAEAGFRLLFSSHEFPDFTHKMIWRRSGAMGNWYYSAEFDTEGWLCPALLKYFQAPPKEIYIGAESK